MDIPTIGLVLIIIALLGIASIVASLLHRQSLGVDPIVLSRFGSRLRGWWLLLSLVAFAALAGKGVVVFLFGAMSFWAMREFITLTPTRPADHRPLFLVFFICIPLQFVLVWLNLYEIYSILIPTYVFLLIPIFMAAFGDTKRYLERVAQISAALLICVYCLSYAPALLTLDLEPYRVSGASLLCFFLLMTQLSEVFQYLSVHFIPMQHSVASNINTTRTWEGLIASCLGSMLVGTLLHWATPFSLWGAGIMSLVIAFMSFGGALTLSAIKRDRGVRDYGTLVVGHGGILDRIDTICFAAPIFFHITRMYLLCFPAPQATDSAAQISLLFRMLGW